jgi:HSP20 family protein
MNIRAIAGSSRQNQNISPAAGDTFEILQREVNRLFDDFLLTDQRDTNRRLLVPHVDVSETNTEIELTAEMPGLEDKDVDITVNDNLLIIRGEKQAETDRKDKNFHIVERAYGSLYRAFTMPNGVDPTQITATMSNGVLKIKIPKPQGSQPKKIEVKAEP